MPVWLDAIPDKAPASKRPDTRRWLVCLVIIMVVGIALTFWYWSAQRTGFSFWFTALGLPFCVWGLIFSLRRFAYKIDQVGTEARNTEREKLLKSEIRRGQRCAWILGTAIQMKGGGDVTALLNIIGNKIPQSELTTLPDGRGKVHYSAIPGLQHSPETVIPELISRLVSQLQMTLVSLPHDLPCWLMTDCDTVLAKEADTCIRQKLNDTTGRHVRTAPGKGLGAFDAWLDSCWETPSVFIAVTLSCPLLPREGEADAMTAVVLSNRRAVAFPDASRLHRPERGSSSVLSHTLPRALLWARALPESVSSAWISGPGVTRGAEWNNACEHTGTTFSLTESVTNCDTAPGYARQCAPWLAIALAQSSPDAGAQVIAVQPSDDCDEVWVVVVSKDEVSKEMAVNVQDQS